MLRGAKERYPPMEKLAFALITATRKLKPYFQAYTVIVLIDKPLRRVTSSPKAARWMALWVIELSEFNIQYCQHTAMKGQVVADLLRSLPIGKASGQKNILSKVSTWTNHPTGRLVEQV